MEVKDEFHHQITEGDIDMINKSFALLVLTPFMSIALMHFFRKLKKDFSISSQFVQSMQNAAEKIKFNTKYQRSSDLPKVDAIRNNSEKSKQEASNLNNLYQEIKEGSSELNTQRAIKQREITEVIKNRNQQSRIKNASPFYQNQQAQRFGIDGSRRLTSWKEKNAERKQELEN